MGGRGGPSAYIFTGMHCLYREITDYRPSGEKMD